MWQRTHSITAAAPVIRRQSVNTPMFIIFNFCVALTVIQNLELNSSGCRNIKAYSSAHYCIETLQVKGKKFVLSNIFWNFLLLCA